LPAFVLLRGESERGVIMKTVVLEGFGGVENFRDAELPEPLPQAGEIRVKIRFAAFNPVDYKMRRGMRGDSLPIVLGMDLSGVVDKVGEGVSEFKPGDEVFAFIGGPRSNGAYAEYAVFPWQLATKKPPALKYDEAASVPLTALTAWDCVFEKARVKKDRETVFVAGGSGGVGSMAIQYLRRAHAAIFSAAGSAASSEYLVNQLGVKRERILMYPGLDLPGLEEAYLKLSGGRRPDICLDFVGGLMKKLCLQIIGDEGRVVSTVAEPEGFSYDIFSAGGSPVFYRSASFHFEYVLARAKSDEPSAWAEYGRKLDEIGGWLDCGKITPPKVEVLGKLSAETVQKAHRRLEEGHVQGKLVMQVGE
jgi:NADPH2:quinone reductase